MSNPIFLPPLMPLEYRAIGIVRGRYLPSEKKITRGTLLAPDGTLIPANLKENAGWLVKQKPELIETEHIWIAWPRTEENHLHLQLKNLRLPAPGQSLEDISQGIDYFSVRGEIINQDRNTGTIAVRLCRNLIPPRKELRKKYQPFTLAVEGFLPGNLNGQFWEFDLCREGNKLVLKDAAFVAQIVLDIQVKEEKKKQSSKIQSKKQPDKMQPVAKPPLNLVLKKNKNG